jgi:hypothetical protein
MSELALVVILMNQLKAEVASLLKMAIAVVSVELTVEPALEVLMEEHEWYASSVGGRWHLAVANRPEAEARTLFLVSRGQGEVEEAAIPPQMALPSAQRNDRMKLWPRVVVTVVEQKEKPYGQALTRTLYLVG